MTILIPGGSDSKKFAFCAGNQVWSLGQDDLLEKGMDTHSSILSWRIPWTEEPGGLQSMGSQRVEHDWATELNWTDSSFQWYLTLCDPMDCITPGSSVHGILQERILEWVAIPFSRGSSLPRGYTWVSCMAGRFFTVWATREAQRLRWPCNRHLNQVHRQIDLKYDGGKTQLAKQSTKGIFMAF